MITIDDLSLWIKENTALSDSSIYKYSRAVNTISNEMQQKGIIPVGLFDMSVLQCDFYLPIILRDPDFISKNSTGNNMYSNALKQYRMFRTATSDMIINQSEVEDAILGYENLNETERTAIVKSRVGQGLFRKKLLEKYNSTCIITGVSVTIEQKFNVCAKVPIDYIDNDTEVYSDGATEEEVSEVINSASEVTEYINRIFETKSLDLLNTRSGVHYSTTEISYIATCADGENIFFTKKYRAFVFDSAKEDVIEVPVDKLSPGDTVIFKSNNSETKDIVTTLLDTYIDEYQTTSEDIQMAYLKARYWKEVLRKYRTDNSLSFKELSKRLETHGAKKHEVTIQSWLAEDSYIVGPQDNETYIAIAEMTQDADMLADPKSFCIACEKIRSIRIGILKLIAKTIISKYSRKLSAEDDMAKVVSENIDDISTLVQIETITPVMDKKAPINMVNRPITIS